jgi:hypothetical protein
MLSAQRLLVSMQGCQVLPKKALRYQTGRGFLHLSPNSLEKKAS